MSKLLYYAVMTAVTLTGFLLGKFVFPKLKDLTATEAVKFMSVWADKMVRWARQFLSESSGEEKMNAVVARLYYLAKNNGIIMTQDEIKAVVQSAYESMKEGEKYYG